MFRELQIQSSVLERVAYSRDERSLIVLFKTGQRAVWEYRGVGPELVSALESAPSKGSQFTKIIRGKHPEVRLGSGTADFEKRCEKLGLDTEKALATFYTRLSESREKRQRQDVIRF